jgi:hypothetical protein
VLPLLQDFVIAPEGDALAAARQHVQVRIRKLAQQTNAFQRRRIYGSLSRTERSSGIRDEMSRQASPELTSTPIPGTSLTILELVTTFFDADELHHAALERRLRERIVEVHARPSCVKLISRV